MLRPSTASFALALVLAVASSPLHAVLIPDSLQDFLTTGDVLEGPVVTSTPAGDVLVLTASMALDPEGEIYRPITGTIRDREGAVLGSLSLDPRLPGGEGQAATLEQAASYAVSFAAAGSASGNFLIVWTPRSATGGAHDIVARYFDRRGQPAGALEVLATDLSAPVAAACNLVTRCVVAWMTAGSDGHSTEVAGRVLDSLFHADQETFHFTATAPTGFQPALSVAVASAGHFAVLGTEPLPAVRRFAGTGVPLGGPITLLPPGGPPPPGTYQGSASGAYDEAGNLTTVFAAYQNGDHQLWSQRFAVGGQPLGGPVKVNQTGTAILPSLVWNHESERFVVAWLGLDGTFDNLVMARTLTAGGAPEGAEQKVFANALNSRVGRIDLAFHSPDRVGVYWGAQRDPNSWTEVHRKLFRLGAGSCEGPDEPAGRSRCARLGPGDRFQVTAAFRGDGGRSTPAALQELTPNASFLFFRGEQNPEVVTKILDGRPINDRFWYFSGAMSNQEYQVTVFDTETDRAAAYLNDPGALRSLADTGTFVDAPLALEGLDEELAAEPVAAELLSQGLAERGSPAVPDLPWAKTAAGVGCLIPTPISLCLNQARFRVEVRWTDFAGNTGQATAVQTTSDGGYFWFFNPNNVELALKILDGRPVNGKFWVFYAALSNVRFVVRIYDETGNQVKVYRNPSGNLASVADTAAF